jgi:hypothetical protein
MVEHGGGAGSVTWWRSWMMVAVELGVKAYRGDYDSHL